MDTQKLASDNMAVVVLGEFDPLTIIPKWLRKMDLIGEEDYDSHSVEIISSGATIVSFGSIQLKVVPETLQVTTDVAADVEATRDLAAGILLSKGSPEVSMMGINRTVHFKATPDGYHVIGDTLAPKDVWSSMLRLPGMLNLGIKGVRDDGYGGSINVQVQPSHVVFPGVFVSINDHYDLTYADTIGDRDSIGVLKEAVPQRSADKLPFAVKILTDGFSASRGRAQMIVDRIASLGMATGKSR